MNRILLVIAALALVAAGAPVFAQQQTTKEQLLGTWKVLNLKAVSEDKVSYPLGDQVTGSNPPPAPSCDGLFTLQ
jgi:hypothetical protein